MAKNGERRGKDIFISYGREEGVKVGSREEIIASQLGTCTAFCRGVYLSHDYKHSKASFCIFLSTCIMQVLCPDRFQKKLRKGFGHETSIVYCQQQLNLLTKL